MLTFEKDINEFFAEEQNKIKETCEFLQMSLTHYKDSILDGFLDEELGVGSEYERMDACAHLQNFPKFLNEYYSSEIEDYFELEDYSSIIRYNSGAFKTVFYLADMPYVLKIAYTDNSDDNEFAQIRNESKLFELADESNIGKFFAASYYIASILYSSNFGFCIGIQERVDSLGSKRIGTGSVDECSTISAEILDKVEITSLCLQSSYSEDTADYYSNELIDDYAPHAFWFEELYDYCGVETFGDIISFLQEHELTDFHQKNVGYKGDVPVFLDYAPI